MWLSLYKLYRFSLYLVFFLLLILVCYLSFAPVPALQSSATLESKIKALHETAAVWVPHFDIDDGKLRSQYKNLFEKVENGQELKTEEGQEYRQLYQYLLLEHQPFFGHFDAQLVAITDLGMDQQNNVGSRGVEGHHDHHDESSRHNFVHVEKSYVELEKNSATEKSVFSVSRIKNAIFIYKNLNDILFHVATIPHTKSIHYHSWSGNISSDRKIFESMLQSFKAAQFMEVNSPEYKANIRLALDDYQRLVSISEARVHQHLSPLELKFVGHWGGWQSLTPNIKHKVKQD